MRIVSAFLICILNLAVLSLSGASAEEEPITIGALFSLSGWAQVPGTMELRGAELAVQEINSRGGVAGRRLRLVVEDTGSDLKGTVTAFHKLMSAHQFRMMIGPNFAEFAEIAAPYAERSGITMISPSGYTKELTRYRPHVFTLIEDHGLQILSVTRHIAASHATEVALVRTNGSYFDGIAEAARSQLETTGVRIVEDISMNPKEANYRSVVTKIKARSPDVVIALLQEGGDLAQFFRQAKEQALKSQIYTYDLDFDSELRAQKELAEGAICYRYVARQNSDFSAKFEKLFGTSPLFTSERAYDAIALLADALRRCGVTAADISACVRNAHFYGQGGLVAFDDNNVLKSEGPLTQLYRVVGGSYVKL